MNAEPFTAHRPEGVIDRLSTLLGRRRLRTTAVAAALFGALFTSACAAGQQAQTADQLPTIDGAEATLGNIQLLGAAINTPVGNFYSAGANATVKLVIVNSGERADQLTALSSPAITGWGSYATKADAAANTGASQAVALGAGLRVSYSVPDSTKTLQLLGLKSQLFPGSSIKITFTFARAGVVTVTVPVALSSTPGTSVVPEPSGGEAAG